MALVSLFIPSAYGSAYTELVIPKHLLTISDLTDHNNLFGYKTDLTLLFSGLLRTIFRIFDFFLTNRVLPPFVSSLF